MNEESYKQELTQNGVDLPELNDKVDETVTTESETPESKEETEESTKETEEESKEEETEQKPREKRSIYDEYKDKKSEVKLLKEQLELTNKEKAELASKLQNLDKAETKEEVADAKDALEAFAKENQLDPKAIRTMRDLFLKDIKIPAIDESKLERINKIVEKQEFEEEFQASLSSIKEIFPKAKDLSVIKSELDRLAHTKGFEDKSLDYIAFVHRNELSNLITPQVKGIEGKSRKEVSENSYEFNPSADYSSMTPKERALWEEGYRNLSKNEGLATDANGKKFLI